MPFSNIKYTPVVIHCIRFKIIFTKVHTNNNNPHYKIIFPYYLRTKTSSYRISFSLPQANICYSMCVFDSDTFMNVIILPFEINYGNLTA